MASPYEKTFELDAAASNDDNYYVLRYPSRGYLLRISCVQLSGNNEGFELDIFNSKEPMDDAAAGSSSAGDQVHSSDAYKVLPTQVAAANENIELMGVEYAYANRDGHPSLWPRFLYARIRPAGSGAKDFQLTLVQNPPEPA